MKHSQNTFYKVPILDGLEVLNAKNHNQNFPFHTHGTFNITLVLEQTFTTKVDDGTFHAPVGSIVITNPDEVHATFCDAKNGTSFFTFYISPDVLFHLNNNKVVFFDNKLIADKALFQKFFSLAQRFDKDDSQLEKKLMICLKILVENYSSSNISSVKKDNLFQQFLEEETFAKFSLENAAAKFGLDKFKFLRLFKEETGLTPNNYIILKRIEKSKELLLEQNDLLEIAIETGFYDANHFNKHFKKITGVTPYVYRNG